MNAKLILSIQKQRQANLEAVAQMVGRSNMRIETHTDIIADAQVALAEMDNQTTDHEMFWRFV